AGGAAAVTCAATMMASVANMARMVTCAFMRARLLVCATLLITARLIAQDSPRPEDKPENYSPLGFEDLRSYMQAYPGIPRAAAVVRASTARYWVFRGVAYRGTQPEGGAWTSLGPLSTTDGGASGSGNFSGRVATLAISPSCAVSGPCRLWVGAAGGGVW